MYENFSIRRKVIKMINKNQTIQVKVYVTENEYKRIIDNANACNSKLSAYARDSALEFNVINVSYDEIRANAKEIHDTREVINRLTYTILKTGEYVPDDLEYIVEKLNILANNQKEFVKLMPSVLHDKTLFVARQARKIARNRITKSKE